MKKFTITVIITITLATLGLSFATTSVSAYTGNVCDYITDAAERKANGCDGNAGANLTDAITSIINAVIGVIGIVAVIFIIVGGVNYMTSQGDTGKLQKAKQTIIWSVVGLIIAALAFTIVNFVIKGLLGQ